MYDECVFILIHGIRTVHQCMGEKMALLTVNLQENFVKLKRPFSLKKPSIIRDLGALQSQVGGFQYPLGFLKFNFILFEYWIIIGSFNKIRPISTIQAHAGRTTLLFTK